MEARPGSRAITRAEATPGTAGIRIRKCAPAATNPPQSTATDHEERESRAQRYAEMLDGAWGDYWQYRREELYDELLNLPNGDSLGPQEMQALEEERGMEMYRQSADSGHAGFREWAMEMAGSEGLSPLRARREIARFLADR